MTTRKRTQNDQKLRQSKVIQEKEKFLPNNLHSLISECETRIRGFVKRRRLEMPDYLLDADNESSSSSSSDDDDIGDDEVFEEQRNYVPRLAFKRLIKRERFTMGQWLFLSYVRGGWSYRNVKNYFQKEVSTY